MITSLTNEKVKNWTRLNEKKYRDENGLFLIEGRHLVEEAKNYGIVEEIISLTEEGTQVSKDVMKKITNQNSIVEICAVCKKQLKSNIGNKVLVLDNVQDPGNVGTIIRSAVSFGFNTIISINSADVFSSKVLRATQGAIFKINYLEDDYSFINKFDGHILYGTSLVNGIPLKSVEKADKMAIILGNEGNGVSKELLEKTDKNIFVEMHDMESLNVAIAASIIMYEMDVK